MVTTGHPLTARATGATVPGMGLMDKAKEAAQQQLARPPQPLPSPPAGGWARQAGPHYLTEVNKGSINMGRWQGMLNERFAQGYRLAHVVEQDGNTVQVFEHRHP